jgi:superfamily II DNA or RNA helicase
LPAIPIHTDGGTWFKFSERLARRHSYEDKFSDEAVELYNQQDGLIQCPRAAHPIAEDDRRVRGEPTGILSSKEFKPRSGQGEWVDEAWHLLKADQSFVAQAPTGFGKTVMAVQLIVAASRPTLVIVPKEDLLDSWEREIKAWTNVAPGRIQGPVVDIQPITLAMIHTLAQRELPEGVARKFGFVVWDECHRLPANTFAATSFQFPALLRMGLSATPKRIDGREPMIFDSIGPIRVVQEALQLAPHVALYKSPWRCPRTPKNKRVWHDFGKTVHIEKDMAKSPERNALLLRITHQAYERGRRVLVFSTLVDHLKYLRECITKHMKVPEEDTALYISGLKKKEREQAATKKIIFATYQMMGEGTDIPWLDVCILGMPRANVEQNIGRVLREFPDKPQPVVCDIQDWDSDVFEAYCTKRLGLYQSIKGATIDSYST